MHQIPPGFEGTTIPNEELHFQDKPKKKRKKKKMHPATVNIYKVLFRKTSPKKLNISRHGNYDYDCCVCKICPGISDFVLCNLT